MYKYFTPTPTTLDDLKKAYRRLAMLHHPDHGGSVETMKAINNENDAIFEILKAEHNARADADTTGKTQRATETAEEFRDILNILLHLDGLTVELCGCWLWISGNTKANKDALKAAGCGWSNSKKMWYWRHPEDGRNYRKSNTSIGEIRTKYGSQVFEGKTETSGYTRIGAAV